MKAAGLAVPAWVEEMLAAGCKTFYKKEAGKMMYYDVASKSYKDVPVNPNIILLPSLKEQNKVVASNKRSLCHRHGRRRCLPRVPQQDERPGRRHGLDDQPVL